MFITECYVENFGVLHQYQYRPEKGFNEIYGGNGTGKSTFAAFIRAMFYGLPNVRTRKSLAEAERRKYRPWQQGIFGGSLCFEAGGKAYRLERTFGERDKEDTFLLTDAGTGLPCTDYTQNIGEALFGIDREAFTATAWITHASLPVQVNDSIHAWLSGATVFENDINHYESAIQKLDAAQKQYQRSGRRGLIYELEERIALLDKDIFEKEKQVQALQNDIDRQQEEYSLPEMPLTLPELGAAQQERLAWLDDYFSAGVPDGKALQSRRQECENAVKEAQRAASDTARSRNVLLALTGILLFLAICIQSAGMGLPESIRVQAGIAMAVLAVPAGAAGSYKAYRCRRDNKNSAAMKAEAEKFEEQCRLREEYLWLDRQEQLQTQLKEAAQRQLGEEQNRFAVQMTRQSLSQCADELTALREQRHQYGQELCGCRRQAEILQKAKEYLADAKITYAKGYTDGVAKHFIHYLSLFDEPLAASVSMDVSFGIRFVRDSVTREMDYLSSGLVDIIWLCERFAIIKAVCKEEKPVIILDDPFVNLDDSMMKRALTLIGQVSNEAQIIYMTCRHANMHNKRV